MRPPSSASRRKQSSSASGFRFTERAGGASPSVWRLKKNQGGGTMPGFHGLFIPGPTNLPFDVRQAMDVPLEDHRAPDFPAFTLPLFRDLKHIFKTEKGQVFL